MQSKPLPRRPDLEALLEGSLAHFKAMSPEERRAMIARQRQSWVIGEMMLDHPEMTHERAEEIYESVI
jgi:hypothetical protein